MHRFRNIFFILVSIAAGAIFIYSAILKLNPIEGFEYTIVDFVHLPWLLAAAAARLCVGLELAIGCLLILNVYGQKKWILKFALFLLIVFNIYLTYLLITFGDNVNCGCFGNTIFITPAASLVKNILLLSALWLLFRYHAGLQKRCNKAGAAVFLIIAAIPFIIFPVPSGKPVWLAHDRYKMSFPRDIPPGFSHGKYIVAFFSLGCPHCRMAAYKMHLMKQRDTALPFYMMLAGSGDNWDGFWQKSHAQNIPYYRLPDSTFLRITKGSYPLIAWVSDGWVIAETRFYPSLNEEEIKKWVNGK